MARSFECVSLVVAFALLACRSAPREQAEPAAQASVRPVATTVAAGRTEPTPCEISYEQTKAAVGANPPQAPDGSRIELAPKDIYLRDCAQLPPPVQQCLVYEYAMKHTEECMKARAAYDGPRTTP